MQGLFVPFECVGSGDTVRVLQRIHWIHFEAFIAETYVQLATTEAMCYSTSWSALTATAGVT